MGKQKAEKQSPAEIPTWCEHIQWFEPDFRDCRMVGFSVRNGFTFMDGVFVDGWKFCPICGEKRKELEKNG